MKKAKCAECGKVMYPDRDDIEPITAITSTGLEYKVYICDDCYYEEEDSED